MKSSKHHMPSQAAGERYVEERSALASMHVIEVARIAATLTSGDAGLTPSEAVSAACVLVQESELRIAAVVIARRAARERLPSFSLPRRKMERFARLKAFVRRGILGRDLAS